MRTGTVRVYIEVASIILSVALIVAILLQARGGGLGSVFGGEGMSGGQYKTRRGLEKTLFQVTIGLSIAFFILVMVGAFLAIV
jgi:preprotein translocase subunit SecG